MKRRGSGSRQQGSASASLADIIAPDRTGLILLSRSVPFLERVRALSGPRDLYAELVPGRERHGVLAAARRLGLPVVATNAVAFANPEDWARHRLLVAIGQNTTLAALDQPSLTSPLSPLPRPPPGCAPPPISRTASPTAPRRSPPPRRSPSAAAGGFRWGGWCRRA